MKKVLSLVLVIAMVLSSFSFAFAANFEDVEGDYEEAINALVALGVVRGYEDGTFRPENILTRAELAVLLVESLGYGGLVAGSTSNFSDTQNHWSNGYVGIAAGTGLVLGYPDGTFKPDQPLTYDEAITMILRAVGYADSALKGNWPTNFKVKAIDLDLLDDVNMATAAADRGGVAQILFNALELEIMELGEEDVLKGSGRLFIDNIATPDTITVEPKHINPDHKDYAGDVVDLAPYMYQNLDVYFNDDDVVVYIKDSNSIVIEGTVDDVNTEEGTFVVKDANGKKHTIDLEYAIDELPMFYNGAENEDPTIIDDILESFESITVVGFEADTNNKSNFDGKINKEDELVGLVAREQTEAKLIANVYKEGRTRLDGIQLAVDDDGDVDLDNVIVKGAVDAIEDIEKDDVVVSYLAKDKSKVELVVSRETVEGKVTRTDANGYAYIAGTKYDINDVSVLKNGFEVELGDKGTFFLDHNGEIVAFDGDSVVPTDYAVVVGFDPGNVDTDGRFEDEFAIDEYPVLKLATQEDEVVIYDVFVEIDEEDGSLTDWAVYGDDLPLITHSAIYGVGDLEFVPTFSNDDNGEDKVYTLIKYSLNEDGQIEAIEIVETDELEQVDTTKSTFKLADGAVIFDKGDKYAVVKESQLDEEIDGWGVYNDDGELEVIITADVDSDEADDTLFALVVDIEYAYNEDDEKVQVATVYMNGEEEELYTDDDDVLGTDGVYKLELDGDVITKATKVTVFVEDAEVDAVSVKNNMIKLGDKWFVVADNALMYTLDGNEYTDFDEFVDLYDVAEGDTVDYVLNTDEEVAFMILYVEDNK